MGQKMCLIKTDTQIGQALNIPLDWFFGAGDAEADLTELKYGAAFRSTIENRQLETPKHYLPDGFYIFWKQLFIDPTTVEALLAKVYDNDGVRTLEICMVRDNAKYGNADAYVRRCKSLLFLSGGNLCMLSMDGFENIVILGNMKRSVFASHRAMSNLSFSGTFFCPQYNDPGRATVVHCALEKVPETTSQVLAAARRCRRYKISDLPTHIKALLS